MSAWRHSMSSTGKMPAHPISAKSLPEPAAVAEAAEAAQHEAAPHGAAQAAEAAQYTEAAQYEPAEASAAQAVAEAAEDPAGYGLPRAGSLSANGKMRARCCSVELAASAGPRTVPITLTDAGRHDRV